MDLSQQSFGLDENGEHKNTTSADSQWQIGSVSRESRNDSNDSNEYFQSSGGHELQILHKKETTLNRPLIPATKFEKLAFIRSFVASPCRTDFIFTQQLNFSVFLWNYIYNVFGKSLPSSYLYIFLGSYAPEYHLFLTKMVPVCHGLNFFWIFVGLLQLNDFSMVNVIFLDYAVCGTLYNNPWNRCEEAHYLSNKENFTCYIMDDFVENNNKHKWITKEWTHEDPITHEHFYLSQYAYFLRRHIYLNKPRFLRITYANLYTFFHFVFSSLLCNQIFKRNVWKAFEAHSNKISNKIRIFQGFCNSAVLIIMHSTAHAWMHYILITIFAAAFVHLYYSTFGADIKVVLPKSVQLQSFMNADFDFLAESMTSPPLLHILTSRSKQEVKIGTDTAIIITSNMVYYIFRGLVEYELRKYCNYITNATHHFNIGPALVFYWPLYLSNLYLGNLYSVFFFYLVFFVEFCSFTITHQCLIEVFVCQWQCLNRWTAALIILVMATALQSPWLGLDLDFIMPVVEMCGTNLITLAEITIICLIYPLGRLVEDITFHYGGISPTLFTIFILRSMFIHYLYKSTRMIKNLIELAITNKKHLELMVSLILFTLIIGIIIKLFEIVYRKKSDWTIICRPDKYWGPSDLNSRVLRKKFQFDKYIASQAPRDLSRKLIRKAESKVYRLGLRYPYDPLRKSTQPDVIYRIKNELG